MPPVNVNLGGAAVELETRSSSNCALMATNQVRCWGSNSEGQLGIGSISSVGDAPGEMPPAAVPLF
jgi:alpha-tubulin suppressor-like RCC1 family protein